MEPLEVKLTIRPSSIDGWWVLERVEHENASWYEKTRYGAQYCHSRRLEKTTDIEGDISDWKSISIAIRDQDEFYSTRCAVDCFSYGVELRSPRNSPHPTLISWDSANYLMKEIEKKVGYKW